MQFFTQGVKVGANQMPALASDNQVDSILSNLNKQSKQITSLDNQLFKKFKSQNKMYQKLNKRIQKFEEQANYQQYCDEPVYYQYGNLGSNWSLVSALSANQKKEKDTIEMLRVLTVTQISTSQKLMYIVIWFKSNTSGSTAKVCLLWEIWTVHFIQKEEEEDGFQHQWLSANALW